LGKRIFTGVKTLIDISVKYHSGIPVYKQIIAAIISAINLGELDAGDKLPSIREFSTTLNINPNTTAKVYRELELTGMIESRAGSGSFVLPQDVKIISAMEKTNLLKKIFATFITEAKKCQITEGEVLAFIEERAQQ
jgi:GntR family transcriptional regulator